MVWSSLWTMADRIRVSQREMAFYAADTYGGQSGSPVFNFKACNGVVGPCIVAVHAYGAHPGGAHTSLNHGPRLTVRAHRAHRRPRRGLIPAVGG